MKRNSQGACRDELQELGSHRTEQSIDVITLGIPPNALCARYP